MKKHLKTILGPIILAGTIAAFTYYLVKHPQTIDQLKQLPLPVILLLLGLYVVSFGALVLITRGSLRVYHKTMSRQENILFNAYSSLINFFGPGQSGPIFRGAYLKKRHNLGVKQYVYVTLVYYGFFAVISAMFVMIGTRPWWQTALAMAVVAVGSLWFVRRYQKRSHIDTEGGLNPKTIAWLFGATVLQLGTIAVIYGIELHAIGAQVSVGQVLAYTGVANFALFVALTPGAIGIREGFLVFSQNLHHIDATNIVAASVVDRGVYLLLLGLLFLLVIGLHAKDKLHVNQLTQKGDSA
jgi:uncharacterized membrane protein YbhN (UPF0104 family)